MARTRERPLCRTRIVTEARLFRIFKAQRNTFFFGQQIHPVFFFFFSMFAALIHSIHHSASS
ncbi:hypothetical protein GYMLUDRAFT_668374 [Collybiopsis luxurians FD-317 M1]|uniref:Unplaced genomic scaffold GYMLUscaffold_31, whole genome shotgun sequence n=1 Tax=Collybiopsis luxurians FD-317 M1 TaxID=944289 RepID=A0A0D0CLL5_9AGAR|nr:hypothetical protein GYMLUDRAFT_668374 [Collybiopsis luxurians FD-317 M1]